MKIKRYDKQARITTRNIDYFISKFEELNLWLVNCSYKGYYWNAAETRAKENVRDIFKYTIYISLLNLILAFAGVGNIHLSITAIVFSIIAIASVFIEHNASYSVNRSCVELMNEFPDDDNQTWRFTDKKFIILNIICKSCRISASILSVAQIILLAIIIILKITGTK